MGIYEELGLKKLINCAGTYTIVGGSKMSSESLDSMVQAAQSHVEIREMQKAVHKKIAEFTNNEDAVVTAGAIVGIYLTMAACISKKYGKPIKYIDKKTITESEIIMFRAHRNAYDRGIELLGASLVELGYPNNINMVTKEDLENAITDKTVGLLYLPSTDGGWVPPGALEINKTIAVCNKKNIPIIVDAAAQLPPKSNLWNFTKNMGANAVLFSGGKGLKGPQTTGLVLGESSLLYWVNENNFPNYEIGRMHKVGREELAGVYTAVKQYIEQDEESVNENAEAIVKQYENAFNENDPFHFERAFPNEAGQPMARAKLIITDDSITAEMIHETLLNNEQAIFTMIENGYIYINPMTINNDEANYVLEVFKHICRKKI